MAEERLQKFLARAGLASRRGAEGLISSGRIRVNGRVVTEMGTKVDPSRDRVQLDGKLVKPATEQQLYRFYKPQGVVSTLRDPQGRPCISDYTSHLPVRVFPVGRLDFDVTGLLLLTNDGDLAHRLLHPRYGAERVYWALVEESVTVEDLAPLTQGIELPTGPGRALAADIASKRGLASRVFRQLPTGSTIVEVAVNVGKKHFVKDLVAGAGMTLIHLCRVAFGPYRLGDLAPGELRLSSEIQK